jgi:hypothetical protein
LHFEPESIIFISNGRPDIRIYDISTMIHYIIALDVRTAVGSIGMVYSGAAAKSGHVAAKSAKEAPIPLCRV